MRDRRDPGAMRCFRVRFGELGSEEGLDKFCRSTIRRGSWRTVIRRDTMHRVRCAEIYSEVGLGKFCRRKGGRSWKTIIAKNPAYPVRTL